MGPPTVLVIGPDEEAWPLVAALRLAGFEAWPDRVGRVAGDLVSFLWADAVVVADPTEHLESRNLRLLTLFTGPKVLMTSVATARRERAGLLDHGFDAVLDAPCQEDMLAARLRRLLHRWHPGSRDAGSPPATFDPRRAGSTTRYAIGR